MQELSVATTGLPEILAVVASGETVRLIDAGREVALVSPPPLRPQEAIDRSPGWLMRLGEKYELNKYGFTEEEAVALRDRSPGPEPPSFE